MKNSWKQLCLFYSLKEKETSATCKCIEEIYECNLKVCGQNSKVNRITKLPSAHICKPCTGNQFCIRKLVSRISRKSNIKELAGIFFKSIMGS